MKKLLFFLISLSIFTNELAADSVLKVTGTFTPENFQQNPTKVHIFVDFHNVLVKKNWKGFAKRPLIWGLGVLAAGSFFDRRCLVGLAVVGGFILAPTIKPTFWNLLGFGKGSTTGRNKVVESFFNQYDTMGLTPVDQTIYNFIKQEHYSVTNDIFVENTDMIQLLQELKNKGCKLHLFSNIGANILKNAKERNLFPHVFELFEGNHTQNVINNTPQSTYTEWKPQGTTFDQVLTENKVNSEWAVMIDDKLTNLPVPSGCAAAQKKAERKGVHYTGPTNLWAAGILHNPKNHAATKQAFRDLGLLD